MTPEQLIAAKALILAWAKSEGFAAIHNGAAEGWPVTDDQIAEDLVMWLESQEWFLVSRDDYFQYY